MKIVKMDNITNERTYLSYYKNWSSFKKELLKQFKKNDMTVNFISNNKKEIKTTCYTYYG